VLLIDDYFYVVSWIIMSSSRDEKIDIEVHQGASDEHVPEHNVYEGHVLEHTNDNSDHQSDNEYGVRRSVRSKTYTEKGLAYQRQIKEKKRGDAFKIAMKKASHIESILIEDVSIQEIQLLYSHWMTLHEIFLDAHEEYSQLLTTDEHVADTQVWYQHKVDQVKRFKTLVEAWLEQTSPKLKIEPSRHSQHSYSVKSSRSGSVAGSVFSARLKGEQQKAELLVKAEALKKKKLIEQAKLRLQLEEEELELEHQMKIVDARNEVVDRFQNMLDGAQPLTYQPQTSRHIQMNAPLVNKDNPIMNASAPVFVSKREIVKSTDNLSVSDEVITAVVRHLKKPSMDITKFDGSPLEYHRFRRQFEFKIAVHCDNDDERMNFLEQFTTGEPHKIVTGLSYLDASVGYSQALNDMHDRYGDVEIVVNAYVKKALNWPVITAGNVKALDEFSLFLQECRNAAQSLEAMRVLEFSDNFRKLVSKLPFHLHDRWRSIVQRTKDGGSTVRFEQLVNFVKTEAKKLKDPIFGKDALAPEQKDHVVVQRSRTGKGSFASNARIADSQNSLNKTHDSPKLSAFSSNRSHGDSFENSVAAKVPCVYCEDHKHALHSCEGFSRIPFGERISFLKSKGLCFGCLRFGHTRAKCLRKSKCSKCQKGHPTVLHIVKYFGSSGGDSVGSTASHNSTVEKPACHMGAGEGTCTMAIIPVQVRSKNGMGMVSTYAFMDPGSNTSFCTEDIACRLGVSGKKMTVNLDTMGMSHKLVTRRIDGLEIGNLNDGAFMELPPLYTKDKMPVSSQHIPRNEDIAHWKHLEGVVLPCIDSDIGILIGNNVPGAWTPLELRTGPLSSPHAARSILGWIVWNVVRNYPSGDISVNRAEVTAILEAEELHQLSQIYQKSVNLDFPEKLTDERKEHSVEDKRFLAKMESSLRLVDGHYEMPLPFRSDDIKLPNNKMQAVHRLTSLQRKLQKNQQFRTDYTEFMDKIISKGYAELVPECDLQRNDGRVWYIPHHGVYHPHKRDKIRVVFDCAALFLGVSLNNLLLHGPDLTSSLIGVLMKFRMENIALMSDIESMFYQVRVSRQDIDCLRFIWWPSGDLKHKPLVYRMLVHLFGATSSPSCANVALRRTAEDNRHLFRPDVCEMISSNFYVDDFLKSVSSKEQALSLVHEVTELCSKGGFKLTKWISNNRDVIQAVPVDERAKELKTLDLTKDDLPAGRALGVKWCIESDCFGFKVICQNVPPSRRRLLSIVSSIFDPLGLVSPFTMRAKIFLQSLCKQGVPWNVPLEGGDLVRWQNWLSELERLDRFTISRCIRPVDFSEILTCQVHHFSDASELGYGVATYVRLENIDNQVHCVLLTSRSRVAPLKKITIPRLELSAATLAVRMQHMILKHLSYDVQAVYYWTDSMAVLRYIWNESSRFQTFVANRLAVIRDGSEVEQWKFVTSKENPADDLSRGLKVDSLLSSQRWKHGPDFLWKPTSEWPMQPTARPVPLDDPEVKVTVNTIVESEESPMERLMSYFSSWIKLKKTVAWLMVAKRCLKSWVIKRKMLELKFSDTESDSSKVKQLVDEQMKRYKLDVMATSRTNLAILSIPEIEEAEKAICQFEQHRFFDIEAKKNRPMIKLDPVVLDGVMRVGGRIGRSELSYETRHPVILPAKSPVSKLILSDAHQAVGHLGHNSILSVVRQKFWIVKASTMIKSLTSKCVICRRYRARSLEQKMADLPENRIKADEPPFTRVGMDFFGPIEVKRGRSSVKRYGVLFTCLGIRAVHLELAASLDTDSCIDAIRRFVARRGHPRVIISDNGTNLIGAERELRQAIDDWNQTRIRNDLQQKAIEWKFNPPTGSHFGGSWERLIRSVRQVLYALLRQQPVKLNDEALGTLFCEVEAILNARPITKMSSDVNDVDAITPNHLLLLRSGPALPCGEFTQHDNYTRRRWRQVQFLADSFWGRWKKEYLTSLQERQKWLYPKTNVSVGDVVLLVDSSPRNSWSLGRIVETVPDKKGLVRVVHVKTKTNVLVRPIHKLCRILEAD
jgi:hypothetical protein